MQTCLHFFESEDEDGSTPPRDINIYLPIRIYTHYFLLLSCTLAVLGRMFSVLYSVLTLISTSCYVKDCRYVLDNCLFLAFYIT